MLVAISVKSTHVLCVNGVVTLSIPDYTSKKANIFAPIQIMSVYWISNVTTVGQSLLKLLKVIMLNKHGQAFNTFAFESVKSALLSRFFTVFSALSIHFIRE